MVGGVPRPRPLNYVSFALRAFHRAIRAHRRLMKLAPARFDFAVVKRLAAEREKDRARHREWAAAIAKVYGVSEQETLAHFEKASGTAPFTNGKRCRNGAETVQFFDAALGRHISARRQRAIERHYEEWQSWLLAGREAIDQYENSRPQAWISLTDIARLLKVASDLGRLSTGLETTDRPPPHPPEPSLSFEEALAKIYGPDSNAANNPPAS